MKKLKAFRKALAAILLAAMVIVPAQNAFAATYTVMPGDSLYQIGRLFNTTSSALIGGNNLSGSMIYPGQRLTVSCTVYTVKSGDTLYLIAKNKGVSLTDLRKANNKYDDKIYPGQALNIPGKQSTASTVTYSAVTPYTQSDVDLLARLITAEAAAEPYNAKVSVGAVVVNRVKSTNFPNTISGVIYEKSYGYYQFTPVQNGWISKPATSDSIKAAYDALRGIDPTNGALYYFDDSTTNTWLWSKPVSIRIDNMVFSF